MTQDARESVLEDVMSRIMDEGGAEAMALDWAILNVLMEDAPPEKADEPSE